MFSKDLSSNHEHFHWLEEAGAYVTEDKINATIMGVMVYQLTFNMVTFDIGMSYNYDHKDPLSSKI